jgi:hypothetical protein
MSKFSELAVSIARNPQRTIKPAHPGDCKVVVLPILDVGERLYLRNMDLTITLIADRGWLTPETEILGYCTSNITVVDFLLTLHPVWCTPADNLR